MKRCIVCAEEFPETEEFFYKCNSGLHGRCKPCHRADVKRRFNTLSQEERSQSDRRRAIKYKYNITPEQYEAMLAAQDNCCAVCERPAEDFARVLHIDHCHETGAVRGLLCAVCNTSLGGFRDDPQLLLRAIEYLARPPAAMLGAAA